MQLDAAAAEAEVLAVCCGQLHTVKQTLVQAQVPVMQAARAALTAAVSAAARRVAEGEVACAGGAEADDRPA